MLAVRIVVRITSYNVCYTKLLRGFMELQKEEIDIINSHVGNMSTEALSNLFRNIDYYINENVSVFIPLYNYCHYAVMPNHSHNSYSFIIYVDNSEDSGSHPQGGRAASVFIQVRLFS